MKRLPFTLIPVLVTACPGGGESDSSAGSDTSSSSGAQTADPSATGTGSSTAASSSGPGSSTGPSEGSSTGSSESSSEGFTAGSSEGSSAASSTGPLENCAPGETQACYSGPPGTADVGLCAAGEQTCGPEGEWGECAGEVTPGVEDCGSPGDEDCDGVDACAVGYPWSHSFGGVEFVQGRRVAVDATGAVIVSVNSSGKNTLDFGGGPLPGKCGSDVSLVKYAADGTYLWSHRFAVDDKSYVRGAAVAAGDDGRIVLTGEFDADIDFGGGTIAAQSGNDGFLAVYGPDGAHEWSEPLRTGSSIKPTWADITAAGDVLLTGHFGGWVDLGGAVLTGAGSSDVFVARFHADGEHAWSLRFGDPKTQTSHGVVEDAAGDIYVGGSFEGLIDPGSGPLASAGDSDAFLAKFDGQGGALWGKRWGGAKADRLFTLAIDGDGRLGFGGETLGGIDIGGGPLGMGVSNYVAVVDGEGAHQWSRPVSAGQTGLQAVSFDGAGALFMTGGFYGANDFGGGPLESAGIGDIFLVKLDDAGEHVWTRSFGDAAHQAPAGVAAMSTGAVAIVGEIGGTVDFGDGPHVGPNTPSRGFVAAFGP